MKLLPTLNRNSNKSPQPFQFEHFTLHFVSSLQFAADTSLQSSNKPLGQHVSLESVHMDVLRPDAKLTQYLEASE